MKNRMEIAKNFAQSIKSKYIEQIILYGSVARGEDNENSDIDILIITDNYEKIEDLIAEEVLNTIIKEDEYVSTNIMTKQRYEKTKNFSFLENIRKEGVILGWIIIIFQESSTEIKFK